MSSSVSIPDNTNDSEIPGVEGSAPQAALSAEVIRKIYPPASDAGIAGLPVLFKELAARKPRNRNELTGIFATIAAETGNFEPITEYGAEGASYAPYYGRGLIQLTWLENYESFSKWAGVDAVSNPNIVLQPEISAKAFVWYWDAIGPGLSHDVGEYASKGDWENVRSIVNAGSPGRYHITTPTDKFMPTIERALQYLPQDAGINSDAYNIDGAGSSNALRGLDCIDAPNGIQTVGNGALTNGDALAQLLGIYAQDASRAYEAHFIVDPAVDPGIFQFQPTKTFELRGVGENLDGVYSITEVSPLFHFDGRLQYEVIAHKEDPNAPVPQIFSLNPPMGDGPSKPSVVAADSIVPASQINQRILENAEKSRGRSTASGPGGGNVACAWAVNNFCVIPSGLKAVGSNPDYVPSMEDDLKGARGQLVSRESASPGDIWIAPDQGHVGIVMDEGAKTILSNSSSGASFSWEDDIDAVNAWYGGGKERIYRLTS